MNEQIETTVPTVSHRQRRSKELNTADLEVGQRSDIVLPPLGEDIEIVSSVESTSDITIGDFAASLAFYEEPMTIIIHPASNERAPAQFEMVYVNGKGIEVLHDGNFVSVGWAPVNQAFTTKRKYVEVIARSKPEAVSTNVIEQPGEDPINRIRRSASQRCPFSVLHDANPKGGAWLSQVLADRA